jgi:HAD superfamily hydrolase (TIGR01509 family)
MVTCVKTVAFGFDLDHTLGLDHKLERTAFVQLLQQRAAAVGRKIDVARATEIADRQIAFYRAGKCPLSRAFDEAFEEIAGRMSSDTTLEHFKELALALAPRHVKPLPGVSELLAQLDAANVPHAILTNGWNPLQQRKADLIGFSQPVFVSDDLGVRKPSIHAFNVLKDYFNLEPQQIWYVGDDPLNDVVGALGAGMRAIWFDWEHQRYPTNVPAPTAIINDILEALSFV